MQSKSIRAARIIFAYFITFAYIYAFNVPEGIWIFMTCSLVLMDNTTVGGTFKKGYRRFKGTTLAFLFALIWVQLFSNNDIANLIGLALGVALAAYYFLDTAELYAGGVMVWTLPLLLINNNHLELLFVRALNIGIGVLIVILLQRFFYPDYARTNVLKMMNQSVSKMQNLIQDFAKMSTETQPALFNQYLGFEEKIAGEIRQFYQWLEEAKVETKPCPEYVEQCAQMFLSIRRIYRIFYLMFYLFQDEALRSLHTHQIKIQLFYNELKAIQRLFDDPGNKNLSPTAIIESSAMSLLKPDVSITLSELLERLHQEAILIKSHLTQVLVMGQRYHYF